MKPQIRKGVAWDGPFTLAEGETAFFQIGPLSLWASRLTREWRLTYSSSSLDSESILMIEVPTSRDVPTRDLEMKRCGFREPPKSLSLIPSLADRPLVVCPEDPFVLAPREEISLYVSIPLWVRVRAGAKDTDLFDHPTFRPTDTWFGPSTMEGELCYATRTKARLNRDMVPERPHRAISVVQVRNPAKTMLQIEKIRLPNLHMSVFVTPTGQYWTEMVTLERHEDGENASIHFSRGAPEEIPEAQRVGLPRKAEERGLLVRAFSGLLK